MPPRAETQEDAVALLERRRAQNRLAQSRFRQKKLSLKAQQEQQQQSSAAVPKGRPRTSAKAAQHRRTSDTSSTSQSSSSPSSSPLFPGPSSMASSSAMPLPLLEQAVSFLGEGAYSESSAPSCGNSDHSSSSASTSPCNLDAPLVSPPVFDAQLDPLANEAGYFDSAAKAPTSAMSGTIFSHDLPASVQNGYATLLNPFGQFRSQDLDSSVNDRLRLADGNTISPGLMQQASKTFSGSSTIDEILNNFTVASPPTISAPSTSTTSPSSYGDVSFDMATEDSTTGDSDCDLPLISSATCPMTKEEFCPWSIASVLTNEKGLLAVILLQSGSPSLAALGQGPDPTVDLRLIGSFPFAKAFYHNVITLGFLDDDLRGMPHLSPIKDIWNTRSAPLLQQKKLGGDLDLTTRSATTSSNDESASSVVSSFQRPANWLLPLSLDSSQQERRMQRLIDSPDMHPTKLQMECDHSIIVDVLPWPSVRDGLIRLSESGIIACQEIKRDLIGATPFPSGSEGSVFHIHGDDPADPEGWEIAETWAQKYSFLLDSKIIRRTNWWRRTRGLPNLDLSRNGKDAFAAFSAATS